MKRIKLSLPGSKYSTLLLENDTSYSPLEKYVFEKKCHAEAMLDQLNNSRENEECCDVILETDAAKILAHKNVLAASSPYFKKMFLGADSSKRNVELKTIESETMALLINYLYTGAINITKSNCRNLISASGILQILTVHQAACEFLENDLNCSNCFEIYFFAEIHGCSYLQEKAFNFAKKNFVIASQHESFFNLSTNKLIELIQMDDLEIVTENDAFYAVQRWYEHSPSDRISDLHKVLEAVRLPLIDYYFLVDCVDSFPALKTNPKCIELIEDAKFYHQDFGKSTKIFNKRTKPRNNVDALQIILVVDGETIKGFCPLAKKWYYITDLPVTIKTGVIVSKKSDLYVASSVTVKDRLMNRIWRYESETDTWHEIPPFLVARSNFGLTSSQQYVYAIAGRDIEKKCLDFVERYNSEKDTWSFLSNMKNKVASAAVTLHNGMIYVAGGISWNEKTVVTNSFQRYDIKEDTWVELSSLSVATFGSAVCTLNDYIYIIGGCTTLTNSSNRMERYDTKNNCWHVMASMNERRFEPGIAVMYNKIYILGGRSQTDDNKYHDTIECYDPEKDTWEIIAKLSSLSLWLSCVPLKIKKSLCKEIFSN